VTFWVSEGISVEVEVLVEGELGMRVVKFRRGVSVVEIRRRKRVQWELDMSKDMTRRSKSSLVRV
jgi:hypothetical protein